jgi:hypothetical protein
LLRGILVMRRSEEAFIAYASELFCVRQDRPMGLDAKGRRLGAANY